MKLVLYKILLFFFFVGSLYCSPISTDFLAFVKEKQQKPIGEDKPKLSEQKKPSYASQEDVEYESVKSSLNKLVALYALIHIGYLGYQRYYLGNTQSNGVSGGIKTFLISWTPGPMSEVIKGSDFIVDSSTIAVQALVAKAVANMILFCAYKDVIDGVEYSLLRFKKMIIRILFY